MSCLLSVVIPAYNVEDFVVPAIQSALNQSVQDLEVIVIDDGSTDSTLKQIFSIRDPRLKIFSQENSGLSATRNVGIKASRGKYIGFLDGDDMWFSEKASSHLSIMEQDTSIGITYNFLAYVDERSNLTGQYLITKVKKPTIVDLMIRNHITSDAIVRKDCFLKAGLFDEKLRACEDYEMWVRIFHKTNYKARLVPKVLTMYRVRPSSLTMNFELFLRNAEMVIEKFDSFIPDLNKKVKDRAVAEVYRIASRESSLIKAVETLYQVYE